MSALPEQARPLAGITVLDLGRVIAGPLCALTLAELGATVIRIEKPGGDSSWQVPPFIHADGTTSAHRAGPDDISLSHAKRDHGKRSVELDYTSPDGHAQLLRLVADADVLIENFRPGVMAQLGLDYPALAETHPGLVYCSISGYGQDGPYRGRHGMALLVAAMSGAIAKTGFADGAPVAPGFPLADHVSSVYGVVGILAALRQRDQTGRGQLVDVSMYDVMTNLLWDEPLDQYEDEGWPERTGNTDLRGAPVNVYPTADGWVALMSLSPGHFSRLCAEIGRPDLAESCPDLRSRVAAAEQIDAAVGAWSAQLTTADAVSRLDAADVPNAPVRAPWSTRTDPQTKARDLLVELEHSRRPGHPVGYLAARIPLVMSGARLGSAPSAEPLGTSSADILGPLAGPG